MKYKQFHPHPALTPYIDAYWTVHGSMPQPRLEKILPDGCVDIIFNLGDDCRTDDNRFLMKSEKAYLVGTMTRYKETLMHEETHLLGIRFKPAAFSVFYNYTSLHELTDKTIECDKILTPDLKQTLQHSIAYLNHFFLNKISKPKHYLFQVIENIQRNKGQIKVDTLVQDHFTTARQLERSFRQHIGVSPKEFISFTRYQQALKTIQQKNPNTSLLDIAFECGYYDHSHLTNEIKRYTGVVPSQL
jgi:AraC-like DNA-binding protein